MAQSTTQRARMVRRAAARQQAQESRELVVREGDLDGTVEGVSFDWQSSLYLDPETNALYDDQDQFARNMREALGADSKLRSLAEILTSPIKGASWSLKPGDGPDAQRIADETTAKLKRKANAGGMTTPIQLVIGQAVSSVIYTRAYFAKGFKIDLAAGDQSVTFSQLSMRPAQTCRLLRNPEDGSFEGFEQDVIYYGPNSSRKWDGRPVQFPPRKGLVFINRQDLDPVSGVSDLEVALWCWRTKRKMLLLWWLFLEGQALPRTLVKHRGDETRARKAARMIASLKSSGVGYLDVSEMDLETLDVSGKGAEQFHEAIKYLDECASGSVLASQLELASQAASGKGSYALSRDLSDTFGQTRIAAADAIAETFTNYGVADLVRWNEGPRAPVPDFVFDQLAGVDEQALLTLLTALATAQSTVLPREFVNELALRAARLFDLDVDKVKSALEKAAADAEKAAQAAGANVVGQQAAAANGAMNAVQHIARQVAGGAPRQIAAAP